MMQLIILGYVPSTDIQINFGFVAQLSAVLTITYLIHLILKEEKYLKNQHDTAIKAKTI